MNKLNKDLVKQVYNLKCRSSVSVNLAVDKIPQTPKTQLHCKIVYRSVDDQSNEKLVNSCGKGLKVADLCVYEIHRSATDD